MALMIKSPAPCWYCRKTVKANEGYLQKGYGGYWFAHCFECYKKNKLKKKLNILNKALKTNGVIKNEKGCTF